MILAAGPHWTPALPAAPTEDQRRGHAPKRVRHKGARSRGPGTRPRSPTTRSTSSTCQRRRATRDVRQRRTPGSTCCRRARPLSVVPASRSVACGCIGVSTHRPFRSSPHLRSGVVPPYGSLVLSVRGVLQRPRSEFDSVVVRVPQQVAYIRGGGPFESSALAHRNRDTAACQGAPAHSHFSIARSHRCASIGSFRQRATSAANSDPRIAWMALSGLALNGS